MGIQLRTVTQGQIVAAILRTIAKQLVKLAATLEVEAAASGDAGGGVKPKRRRTKADYRGFLGGA